LISTGNYLALSGGKTHGSIDDRIGHDFNPVDNSKYSKVDYLKKVSLINTYNAQNELWNLSHIKKAQELVDKNIKSGVAIEMDYLIKAIINRRLFNNKEKIDLMYIKEVSLIEDRINLISNMLEMFSISHKNIITFNVNIIKES
jgi:hypothetical protein